MTWHFPIGHIKCYRTYRGGPCGCSHYSLKLCNGASSLAGPIIIDQTFRQLAHLNHRRSGQYLSGFSIPRSSTVPPHLEQIDSAWAGSKSRDTSSGSSDSSWFWRSSSMLANWIFLQAIRQQIRLHTDFQTKLMSLTNQISNPFPGWTEFRHFWRLRPRNS